MLSALKLVSCRQKNDWWMMIWKVSEWNLWAN